MSSVFAVLETNGKQRTASLGRTTASPLKIEALSPKTEDEVLAFLSRRSLHTFFMAGLIRDNGLVSFSNRGTFFGCRDQQGQLEGVALIGPKTLVESHSEAALETLGRLVPDYRGAHLIRGEEPQIERLLEYYRHTGRQPRLIRREVLLQQTEPATGIEPVPHLRLATPDDLPVVTSINATLAVEESGVNPMSTDPQGMLERTEKRITQNRVWVLCQNGKTIFKADIVSATPEVAFIEGVFVRCQERRKGYGLRCMTQLARNLLDGSNSICLVVNEENARGRAFYDKVGYKFSAHYNTAYFAAL
jgi:predicted GNAT family acetyltransferase